MIIGEDLENRIALQDRLRHITKRDAMGQFTSGVAHNFNNILAVILGNIELIEGEAPLSPDRDAFIRSAVAAVIKGRSLTRRVLSFAKKAPMAKEVVCPEDAIRETVQMFERTAGSSLAIHQSIQSDLPDLYFDPGLLQTALLNP